MTTMLRLEKAFDKMGDLVMAARCMGDPHLTALANRTAAALDEATESFEDIKERLKKTE